MEKIRNRFESLYGRLQDKFNEEDYEEVVSLCTQIITLFPEYRHTSEFQGHAENGKDLAWQESELQREREILQHEVERLNIENYEQRQEVNMLRKEIERLNTENVDNLLPASVSREFRLTFSAKRVRVLGDRQRKILEFVEKKSFQDGTVSYDTLRKKFGEQIGLYYRLEQLRFLGFIEKKPIDVRGGIPQFTYFLSSEYENELKFPEEIDTNKTEQHQNE